MNLIWLLYFLAFIAGFAGIQKLVSACIYILSRSRNTVASVKYEFLGIVKMMHAVKSSCTETKWYIIKNHEG